MVKSFVTIYEGVITGIHSGDINADLSRAGFGGHVKVEIPKGAIKSISINDRLNYYTPDWQRKSDCCLIDEGIIAMPEGYIREGDALRPMTDLERVVAGLDAPPSGFKVQGDEVVEMSLEEKISAGLEEIPDGHKLEGGELIPMSQEERLEAGQISQDEYNQHIADMNIAELNRRLTELLTPEATTQAEVDETYATQRRAKQIALLAVRDQPGWPLEAEWPTW